MRNGDYILSFSEKDKQKAMDDIYFEALEGCKELFVLYEKEFELLTSALLEKETLSGEEVEAIVFNKTIESENSELPLEKE
jgi:ATP-dependent Zn protease